MLFNRLKNHRQHTMHGTPESVKLVNSSFCVWQTWIINN